MKRLYYLTKNADMAEVASDKLHEKGISDWNFHVLGKDKANIVRHHLHGSTPIQELDIIRSGERGIMMGFGAGVFVALLATIVFPNSVVINVVVQSLLIIGFLSLFGAWVGGLIGVSTENYKIRRFHDRIEEGYFLLMIDVKPDQEAMVVDALRHIPEIKPAGEDSTIVDPFAPSLVG